MALVRAALVVLIASALGLGCADDAETADPTPASTTSRPPEERPARPGSTTTTSAPPAVSGGFLIEDGHTGEGPRVAVLGDSLTVQGHEELRAALPDVALRIAAVRGEGFASGGYSQRRGETIMRDAAADIGATAPDVAVVALGTNDAWTPDGTLPEALQALDTIVADLGDACLVVVLVDPAAPAEDFDTAAAAEINARLEAVADEVVDWGAVAVEPGVLSDDGIHPTVAGQERWAEVVAEGVRACTGT